MIFVFNNLKYDTDKMELVSEKCKYVYSSNMFGIDVHYYGKNVKLFRSIKGNWALTYQTDYKIVGIPLDEEKVKELLIKYDLNQYEEFFGELEDA